MVLLSSAHSSSSEPATAPSARRPLHIVNTTLLAGNEVLVHYSDGSAALFEAEELEKLRPTPKHVYASVPEQLPPTPVAEPVFAATPSPEPDRSLVLDGVLA